jgi:hypothetical protein
MWCFRLGFSGSSYTQCGDYEFCRHRENYQRTGRKGRWISQSHFGILFRARIRLAPSPPPPQTLKKNLSKPVKFRWKMFHWFVLEQKCPGKMEWTECGSACPRTCTNLNSDKITCLSGCVDGCHCPPNLWKDGNQCVPKEECSCNHAGIYYKHRSIRSSACEQW